MEAAAKWLREKGLAKAAERADRENTQGAVAVAGRRRRRRRSSSSSARPTSWPSPTTSSTLVQELADLGRRPRARPRSSERKDAVDDLKVTLKENIELGPGRPLRGGRRQRRSTPTCTSRTARRQRRARRAGRRHRGAGPRHRRAHRLRQARSTSRRDEVPEAERRRGARRRSLEITQGRGQARGGLAEDRRGPAQRLVQASGSCSTRARPRREADGRPAARRRPTIVRFAQVVIGG